MVKALVWVVVIIFLIGLLVVTGVLRVLFEHYARTVVALRLSSSGPRRPG